MHLVFQFLRFRLPSFTSLFFILFWFGFLFGFAKPAFAIYKCIDNTSVIYSDTPCPDGSQVAIDLPIASSPIKDKDAGSPSLLKRQKTESKQLDKQLEKERHQQAAKEESQQRQAARAKAVKQKKCASLALSKKWAEEDAHTSNLTTTQAAAKAKKKAHRAEEKYLLNCS